MNHVFPVLGHDNDGKTKQHLFPFFENAQTNIEGHDTKPDWLHNASFNPDLGTHAEQEPDTDCNQYIANPEPDCVKLGTSEGRIAPDSHIQSHDINAEDDFSKSTKKQKVRRHRESSFSDESDVEKKRHKKKHKHKHKKHKHRRETLNCTSDSHHQIEGNSFKPANKVFREEIPGLEAKDAFRIDRKPDKNTYTYGSLYKLHVAQYKQYFITSLSLDYQSQVCMKHRSKKEKVKENRYYDKESRRLLRSMPEKQIFTHKDKKVPSRTDLPKEVFIEISKSDTVDKKSAVSGTGNCDSLDIRDQLLDQQTKSYIEGKRAEEKSSPLEEGDNSIENSELWQLTSEFNRKTRENPKDIQVWLDFVKFQDRFEYEELVASKFTESHTQKKMPKQVITDKKILILQKAINANPDSLLLKMKYLELCQDNLNPDKVYQEIKSLLSDNPTNMTLWKQYLAFGQSRMFVFSVTKTTQLYSECFQRLLSFQDQRHKSSTEFLEISDVDLINIFVQYCYFQEQAGHKEKALACFQALIEFNIFCPQSLKNSNKGDKCAVFESFWDSGVARMGENGARGWRYWVGNKDNSESAELLMDQMDSEDVELEILQSGECKWKLWLQIEKLRETFHWLPWRPDLTKNETEEDCEDMDRLVLFDDISPFTFSLRTTDHNFELVLQFLQFLGVSLNDHFLPRMVRATESQLNLDRLSQVMFRNHESIFRPELLESGHEISPTRKTFIDNVFQQLTQSSYFSNSQESMLTTLWLGFQTSPVLSVPASLKTIKKFAKSLLKETQNRNNMYVWCEYVNRLRYLSGLKDAKSVAEMAFTLQGNTTNKDDFTKCGFTKLYRVYVEMLLGVPAHCRNFMDKSGECITSDQVMEAMQCLVCFVERENFKNRTQIKVGGTLSLKVSKTLKEMCGSMLQNLSKASSEGQESLSIFTLEYFCEITKCFALFSWCVNQELNKFVSDLDNVLSSVQQCLCCTESSSDNPDSSSSQLRIRLFYVLEDIHKYKTHFILYLMSVVPLPLHHLRDAVSQALQIFPQHSFFLSVFVDMEQRGHITGRLDRYFNSILKEEVSPVAVTYAVYNLLRRLHSGAEQTVNQTEDNIRQEQKECQMKTFVTENSGVKSGIIHKVRSYLERALNCQTVQHCPLVWRLYLYTEMKFGTVERTRGIFYRALQQCPWAKALYLDGVMVFGEEKLQDMTDLLLEKELRLQIPLEELDILLDKE